MRRLNLTLALLSFSFVWLAAAELPAHGQTTFRMATLAPEGSAWMKGFREWGTNVEKRTEGRAKFKFFAGGVQGDEREAVRKMRQGALSGAAVTGVGLGLISGEVRVLELPLLFKSNEELDYVRTTLSDDFRKKFNEKGFELISWGEVGWVYIFSNIPIRSEADLKKTKMWAWTDDPLIRSLLATFGVQGEPLGVPDVLPSLQTGLIDACYGSPLSTVALQWNTKVKYMSAQPYGIGVAAVVVSKKDFDKLSPGDQKIMLEEGRSMQSKGIESVRRDNDRALNKMKTLGLQVVPTPPELLESFKRGGAKVSAELTGKMFTREWLEKVKKTLADYRKAHGG
jgi:TRAP-type C4-dicarboxylate transport system substrate-binding protein